jgi:hypothetical protein
MLLPVRGAELRFVELNPTGAFGVATTDFYYSPLGTRQLGKILADELSSGRWKKLLGAVAWVKRSGARQVKEPLERFVIAGGLARIAVGVDHRGTTIEGVDMLAAAVGSSGEIWIVHHSNAATTFHPKALLLENDDAALALIGSGNLTEGGLFANFELGAILRYDLRNSPDVAAVNTLREQLEGYVRQTPISLPLTAALRLLLIERRDLVTEVDAALALRTRVSEARSLPPSPFGAIQLPSFPRPAATGETLYTSRRQFRRRTGTTQASPSPAGVGVPRGFVMLLGQTDAGVGQTSAGTSPRSPEIFIPLAARDAFPEFWGWPNLFIEDPQRPEKFDRQGVPMRLGTNTIAVNMFRNPVKHDFRLRSQQLRAASHVGDILRIEIAEPNDPFEYTAEIIPNGSALHAQFVALCTQIVANSPKRWGYYDALIPTEA